MRKVVIAMNWYRQIQKALTLHIERCSKCKVMPASEAKLRKGWCRRAIAVFTAVAHLVMFSGAAMLGTLLIAPAPAYAATEDVSLIRAGQTVSAIAEGAGNTVDVTLAAAYPNNNLVVGQGIVISGTTNYNGTFTIATVTDQQNFAYSQTNTSRASESTGTAGGDYTTLTAWEAGEGGDLVTGDRQETAEAYNDWASGLDDAITIDGNTTDATRYMKVTVAETDRHDGTAGTGFKVDLSPTPAFLSGWSYRKLITIQNANVDADLTDFPVYVYLDPAGSGLGLASKTRDDGFDIRFTQSDGTTLLSYERESYSEASGNSTGNFWVKVPTVTAATATTIYIYYGKSDATDGEDAVNVWTNNYVGVWHMNNNFDESTGNDSTAINDSSTSTTGKIANGRNYAGSPQYTRFTSSLSTARSIEFWVRRDSWVAGYTLDARNNLSAYIYKAAVGGFNQLYANGVSVGLSMNNVPTGEWAHVYVTASANFVPGINVYSRGNTGWGSQGGIGDMDEFRISSIVRTAEWIKFGYYNVNEADNELSFGSEVVPAISSPFTVSDSYTVIEYVEITGWAGTGVEAIEVSGSATGNTFSHLLIHDGSTGVANPVSGDFTIYNSIIYDITGIGIDSNATDMIYDNTVYSCSGAGIDAGTGGTTVVRNSYAGGSSPDFTGTPAGASSNNASADATAPGANSHTSEGSGNFVSVTDGSEDFHLVSGATNLIDGAYDLSGTFEDDIEGVYRPDGVSEWDIGASERHITWDDGGVDSNWDTVANWSEDALPAAGDIVVFDSTSTAACSAGPAIAVSLKSMQLLAGYTGTVTLGTSNISVTDDINLDAGTLSAGSYNINVAGDWAMGSSGTFTAGTGTVTFNGTDQSISGSNTFYNFSKTHAGSGGDETLTFDNTGTQTIGGLLTLDGFDGTNRINLVSDSPGTQWSLTANGTFAVDFIDVADSDASGGSAIDFSQGIDSGNNLNWGTGPTVSSLGWTEGTNAAAETLTVTFSSNIPTIGATTDYTTVWDADGVLGGDRSITPSAVANAGGDTTVELTISDQSQQTDYGASGVFRVTVSANVKDAFGAGVNPISNTAATTAPLGGFDTVAPQVSSLAWAEGADTAVETLIVTFSETIATIGATSDYTIVWDADAVAGGDRAVTASAVANAGGDATVELTIPDQSQQTDVANPGVFRVTVNTTNVKDTAGNAIGAGTNSATVDVDSFDTAGPDVSSVAWAQGADTAVETLTVTFSEVIATIGATTDYTIVWDADAVAGGDRAVTASAVANAGSDATIEVTIPDQSTQTDVANPGVFRVTVNTTNVKDTAGNGIGAGTAVATVDVDSFDTTAPTISESAISILAGGTAKVGTTVDVAVVGPGDLASIVFTAAAGGDVLYDLDTAVDVAFNDGATAPDVTASDDTWSGRFTVLDSGTTTGSADNAAYGMEVFLTDVAGNTQTIISTTNTIDVDNIAPTIDTDGTPGNTYVHSTKLLTLNFSEAMDVTPTTQIDATLVQVGDGGIFTGGGAGYSYRKQITVQAANIDANLTDFPVYIKIDTDADIGGNMQDTTNYYDIRFTDSSSNIIPYEQESMVISTGSATGNYWVKTDLNATTGATLYVYYGKAGDTDGSNAAGVWDTNFQGVWHMNKSDGWNGTTGEVNDSAGTNDGTAVADATTTTTNAKIYRSGTFDGTGDYVILPNVASLNIVGPITITAWIKTLNDTIHIVGGYDDSSPWAGYGFGVGMTAGSENKLTYWSGVDVAWRGGNSIVNDGNWHYVAIVVSGTTGTFYLDGIANGTPTTSEPNSFSGTRAIGARRDGVAPFNGTIDEVRITNDVRTAQEIKFEYYNVNEADNELTWGSEVSGSPSNTITLSAPEITTGQSDGTVVTFTLTDGNRDTIGGWDAAGETVLNVKLTNPAVLELAGNGIATTSWTNLDTWTKDTTDPQVSSLGWTEGAEGLAETLTVTFSEIIGTMGSTSDYTIVWDDDNVAGGDRAITASAVANAGSDETVELTIPDQSGQTDVTDPGVFKVTVNTNVLDTSGNGVDAANNSATVDVDTFDASPPTYTVTGASLSGAGDTIALAFDEAMLTSTLSATTGITSITGSLSGAFTLANDTGAWASNTYTVTLNEAVDGDFIQNGETVTVVLSGVTDLAGNAEAGLGIVSAAVSAEGTAPTYTVTGTSITAAGDTIALAFDESMAVSTLSATAGITSITGSLSGAFTLANDTGAWASNTYTVTLNEAVDGDFIQNGETVTVVLSGVTDLAGNAEAGLGIVSAAVSAEGTVPVLNTVTASSVDNAGDTIALSFSEEMTTSTIANGLSTLIVQYADDGVGTNAVTLTTTNATVSWTSGTAVTITLDEATDDAYIPNTKFVSITPNLNSVDDLVGNSAANSAVYTATGVTAESTIPVLDTVSATSVTAGGDTIALSFSEEMTTSTIANGLSTLVVQYADDGIGTNAVTLTTTNSTVSWTSGTAVTITLDEATDDAYIPGGKFVSITPNLNSVNDLVGNSAANSAVYTAAGVTAESTIPVLDTVTAISVDNAGDTIALAFSEEMTTSTIADGLSTLVVQYADDGIGTGAVTITTTNATVSWTSGTAVTITLDEATDDAYIPNNKFVSITPNLNSVNDLVGNSAANSAVYTADAVTAESTIPVLDTVTATSVNNAGDTISLSFSEEMTTSTIANGLSTLVVQYANDGIGTGAVTLTTTNATVSWTSGTAVTITLDEATDDAYIPNNKYVSITPNLNSVNDLVGNSAANSAVYTASGVTAEGTAPTVPAINIDVNNSVQPNTITIQASENLDSGTAQIAANWLIKDNSEAITYNIASASLANDTVTLTLAAVDSANNTTFITNAQLTAGIKVVFLSSNITDLVGNAFVNGTVTESGGSHTTDSVAPTYTVTGTSVDDGGDTIALAFDEVMTTSTLSNTIGITSITGSLSGAFSLNNDSGSWNVNVYTVTLDEATDGDFIQGGETVTVILSGVTDLAGNAEAGAGIVSAAVDAEGIIPTFLVTAVSLSGAGDTITLTFNEAMDTTTITTALLQADTNITLDYSDDAGNLNAVNIIVTNAVVSWSGNTAVTITLNEAIDGAYIPGNKYVGVTLSGVTDLVGNSEAGLEVYSAQIPAESVVPTYSVTAASVSGAGDTITLAFNEAMDVTTLTTALLQADTNITLDYSDDAGNLNAVNIVVTNAAAAWSGNTSVTITLNEAIDSAYIPHGKYIGVTLLNVTDLAGNSEAGAEIYTSAGVSKESDAPTYNVSVSSVSGGDDTVTLSFNESMDVTTITTALLQADTNITLDYSDDAGNLNAVNIVVTNAAAAWSGNTSVTITLNEAIDSAFIPNLKYVGATLLSVTDLAGNSEAGLEVYSAQVTAEATAPALVTGSNSYVHSSKLLTLNFSERIDVSEITAANVQIGDDASGTNNIVLSTPEITLGQSDGTVVTFTLTDGNRDTAANWDAAGKLTLYVKLTNPAIKDIVGNGIATTAWTALDTWTKDVTNPQLVSWDLVLNTAFTAKVILTFDEVMDASTLSAGGITIQDAAAAGTSRTLTDSAVVDSDSAVITVNLSTADLDAIKQDGALAISQATSYLTMALTAIDDMSGNDVIAIIDTNGVQVTNYTPSIPMLTSEVYTHSTKELVVTFDEVVDASTVIYGSFEIADSASGGNSFVLTSSDAEAGSDLAYLTFTLTDARQDTISNWDAAGTATIYLGIAFEGIKNMSGEGIATIARQAIDTWTEDTAAPTYTVVAASVTGAGDTIELTFDESMDTTTITTALLQADANITLDYSDNAGNTNAVNITVANATVSWTGNKVVTITLDEAADGAYIPGGKYIGVTLLNVTDLAGNAEVGAEVYSAQVTAESAIPTYSTVAASVSGAGDTIELTFNESMDVTTITTALLQADTNITLDYSDDAGNTNAVNITVTNATVSWTGNTVATITLDEATDSAYIPGNKYVGVTLVSVNDLAGNAEAGLEIYSAQVTAETTVPTYTAAAVSVNAAGDTITLTFDEPMDTATISTALLQADTNITLDYSDDAGNTNAVNITVTNAVAAWTGNTAVTLTLNEAIDSSFIPHGKYIGVTLLNVTDLAGNAEAGAEVYTSASVGKETIIPTYSVSATSLSGAGDTIELTFNESMDVTTITTALLQANTNITLDYSDDAGNTNAVNITVTNATVSWTGNTAVTITLDEATDEAYIPGSKYIGVTLLNVTDLTGNAEAGAEVYTSAGVSKETTAPTFSVAATSFSGADDTITLTFDEPMDTATISAALLQSDTNITLDYSDDAGNLNAVNIVVTNATAAWTGNTAVTITLNEITDIAYIPGGKYIGVTLLSVTDLAGNAAAVSEAYTSAGVIAESIAPVLAAANIDVNNNVQPNTITIQASEQLDSAAAETASNWTITDNSGGITYNIASASLSNDTATLTLATLSPIDTATFVTNAQIDAGIKVVFLSSNITDLAGNAFANATITESGGLHTKDITAPTLSAGANSYVDSTKLLTLNFSENIDVSEITAANMQLGDDGSGTNSITLSTLEITTGQSDGTVVTWTLTDGNRDTVGSWDAAGSPTLYVKLTNPAIKDLSGLNGIVTTSWVGLDTWTKDTTRPTISSAALNYGTGVLVITGSENMDSNPAGNVSLSGIHINDTTGADYVTLTGATVTPAETTTVTITLTEAQRLQALAVSGVSGGDGGTVVLDVDAGALRDMSGNTIFISDNNAVTETADTIAPTITSATLDYNDGTLTVNLSETVLAASTVTNAFHINNITGTDAVTLSQDTEWGNDAIQVFTLTEAERVAALAMSGVAGGDAGAVVLDVDAGAVTDMAGAVSIIDDNNTVTETADTTAPTLSSWSLNMNTQKMTLNFSETINAAAFSAPGLTIQDAATAATSYTLATSTTVSANGTSIVVDLSSADVIALSTDTGLAVSKSTSYLRVGAAAIDDMGVNDITVIADGSAIQASSYISDTTKPTVSSVTYNANDNNRQLVIAFSEAIDATPASTRIDLTKVYIRITGASSGGVVLTGAAVTETDGTSITITTTETQRLAIQALGSRELDVDVDAFRDMAGNLIDADTNTTVSYTVDTTKPSLSNWELNMETGVITLNYSETIDANLTNAAYFTIQDAATASTSFTLTGGTVSVTDSTQVTITMTTSDINSIKAVAGLAKAQNNSYLRFSASAVTDIAANTINAVADGSAVNASAYTADTMAPNLSSWDLDMIAEQATLNFDEPIDAGTLAVTGITMQDAATANTSYTLTNSTTASSDGMSIVLDLSATDLNAIKLDTGLAVSQATSYIRLTALTFDDMAANDITAIVDGSAVQASTFTADTTKPTVSSLTYNANDNNRQIVVTFDEIIDATPASQVDLTKAHIRITGASSGGVTLTGAAVTETDGTSITITTTEAQRLSIQALGSRELDIDTGAFRDIAGNLIAADTNTTVSYTADTNLPVLSAWDLNMDTGVITLNYSETMDASSIVNTNFTVQDAATAATSYALTGGAVSTTDSTQITITLNAADLDGLKADTGLAAGAADSYLIFARTTEADMVGNAITAVSNGSGIQVTNYTADTTAPNLSSWTLNMNTQKMTLNFDERVSAAALNVTGLTIQDALTAATSYTLIDSTSISSDGASIVIDFSAVDLNAIIANSNLATSINNSYLRLTAVVIDDMAGNDITVIADGSAVQASGYTADITKPTVESATLDYNDGRLVVTFSEIVDATKTVTGSFHLNDVAGIDDVTLTQATASGDGLTLTFDLTEAQRVAALAISGVPGGNGGAVVLDVDQYAITDMANNKNIDDDNNAVTETADTTAPTLSDWSLDMNSGEIVLNFTRTINGSITDAAKFIIQDAATASYSYTLTGGAASAGDSTQVTITMASGDMNSIKAIVALAAAQSNSYVRFSAAAVTDMAGNTINVLVDGSAVQASSYIADTTAPTLSTWDLNMNTGVIILNYFETMDASTIAATNFTVQDLGTATTSRTLTGGTVSTTDSTQVTITMSAADINAITANTNLAIGALDSYLVFARTTEADMAGVAIAAVVDGSGVNVTTYTADTTAPALSNWNLNMNTGVITLNYSETMDASTIAATNFTVQDAATATTSRTLTGGVVSVPDSTQVTITLNAADLNNIKANTGLGTGAGNSYLRFARTTEADMAGVAIAAVTNGNGVNVNTYNADTTAPALSSWDLDMNVQQLTLTFNESVNAGTLVTGEITIQNQASATTSYTLTTSTSASSNGTNMVIDFSGADLGAILMDTGLATSLSDSYLRLTALAIDDMAGNDLTAIADGSAVQAAAYTVDTTKPTISSATLDYNNGTLIVSFSEIVDASATVTAGLHINNVTGTDVVTLSQATASGDGTSLTFILTEAQRVAALAISGVAGGDGGAVILDVDASAISDMAGAAILVDDNNTVTETADTTVPVLSNWALNMETGIITLNYSETIDANLTNAAYFTIQDAAAAANSQTLTGGTVSVTDSTQITITMSTSDINSIKAVSGLAKTQGNSYLRFAASAVTDMAGQTIAVTADGSAVQASSYTADTMSPALSSWTLDMNAGTAALNFDEPLDASTLAVSGITLQDAASAGTSYALTDSTTASNDGTSIVITLSGTDLNAIKADASLATAQSNSYLRMTAAAFDDMAGNDLTAIADGSGVQASSYTADTTAPTLSSWDLNMNTGVITLNYSETMDASTIVATNFTVQDAATAAASRTLSGGMVSSTDSTQITITLNSTDLNLIKFDPALAAGAANSYLRFARTTEADMAGAAIAAVADGSGVQVSGYTADTTAPVLSSWDLNMQTGVISFTFDEIIDVSATDATDFVIQDAATAASGKSYTLTGGTVSTTDSTQLTITLSTTDLNGVKAIEAMAKAQSNSYIRFNAAAVTDMATNTISVLADGSAVQASSYTADTTVPTLSSWVLDMSAKTATLTFSEAVDASTFAVGGITFQDAATATTSRTLTDSTTASNNGTSIVISLSAADSAALYANASLVISQATSYLRLTSAVIDDMAGNVLTAIADGSAVQAGSWTAKSTFAITAPASGTNWAVNETTRAITWTAGGNLNNVTLWYATENDSYAVWTRIDSASAITAASQTHTWSLIPDILVALGIDPQSDPNVAVKIKLIDTVDASVTVQSDAFNVIYYTITWAVRDSSSQSYLTLLSVNEVIDSSSASAWLVTDNTLNSPITRNYYYETYTTTYSKENYLDTSALSWTADSTKTITVYMESTIEKEWNVFTQYAYDGTNDRLNLNVWVEREGRLMTVPTSATVTIYDSSGSVVNTLGSGVPADARGVFWVSADTSSWDSDEVYFAKTSVVYSGTTYTSGKGIAISIDKVLDTIKATQASEASSQSSFRTATTATLTTVETATTGTGSGTIKGAISDVETKVDTVSGKVTTVQSTVSTVNTNVIAILEDTGATLPAQIKADVVETIEKGVLTEILTRNATIREDETITIRYRTATGLSPTMTIYDADNTVLSDYNGVTMTEISTIGIYEYDITAKSGWGTGDFTVVCAESTRSSTDSMVLTVKALYVAGGGVEESLDALGYAVTKVYSRTGTIVNVLGTSADTGDLSTVFGMINGVDTSIDNLNLSTVSTDARNARANALKAYTAVSDIKSQVDNVEAQVNALHKLVSAVEAMRADLLRVSKGISEQQAAMVIPPELLELKKLQVVEGAVPEKPEDVSTKEELDSLNNKIEELTALVKILKTLIEEESEQPVIEGWFETE